MEARGAAGCCHQVEEAMLPPLGSLLSGQRGRLTSAETSSLSASPLVRFCSRFLRDLPLDLSEIVHGRALYQLRGMEGPFPPVRSRLAIGCV